jgi:hypothetical protein
LKRLAGCIERGLAAVAAEQCAIRTRVDEIQKIAATLCPESGTPRQRRLAFGRLRRCLKSSIDPVCRQMAVVMSAFVCGLFAGEGFGACVDNLDLERWFRIPKGHERRIHGRSHAGVRLVQEGATLMVVLDAHREGRVFTVGELSGYRNAQAPQDELEAMHRRKVMRKARSKKNRPKLLAHLEKQYHNAN